MSAPIHYAALTNLYLPESSALLEHPEPIGPGLWGKANFVISEMEKFFRCHETVGE
jgi:hypothetical protein